MAAVAAAAAAVQAKRVQRLGRLGGDRGEMSGLTPEPEPEPEPPAGPAAAAAAQQQPQSEITEVMEAMVVRVETLHSAPERSPAAAAAAPEVPEQRQQQSRTRAGSKKAKMKKRARIGPNKDPLVWSATKEGSIVLQGATATHAADNTSMATAVCALHPMSKGLHRADFRVVQCSGAVGLAVGIVRKGFDPQRAKGVGSDTEKSWVWSAHGGLCRHSMRSSVWEGEPGRTGQLRGRYATGDVVGLLLDLSSADGDGELVALKDGEELGTLVSGLSGTFYWSVELCFRGDCVTIERIDPQATMLVETGGDGDGNAMHQDENGAMDTAPSRPP